MSTTRDLQQKLTDALDLLRKSHPEIDIQLPTAYLNEYNIFSSFLPYDNDMARMTATQIDQLKYYKTFWIIQQLLIHNPAILNDHNSEALRKIAYLCLKNAPQLNDIFGKRKKVQENAKQTKKSPALKTRRK